MKVKSSTALSAWLFAALLSVGGVAMAEDDSEASNRELCLLEAEEAGMIDEGDIRDYVEQCLEELRQQAEDNSGDW